MILEFATIRNHFRHSSTRVFEGYWDPGTPYYGPIYQTPHVNWECVGASLTAIGDKLTQIASMIVKNPAGYGAAASSARGLLRGTVSAAGFADVLLAALGASELIALAGAVGVTIASIAILVYCSRQ